jgi:hypothetical protein
LLTHLTLFCFLFSNSDISLFKYISISLLFLFIMKGLFISSLLVGASFALPTAEANTDTVEVSLSNITPIFTDAKLSTRAVRGKMEGKSFADPTLIYGEGSWKAYGTSNGHNIPYATAQDGFNFTYVGDALKKRPSWATTAGLWAPDVVKLVRKPPERLSLAS